ncbi:conserved Plasmodium protein, unknown function [Plasmodium ovale]|uniref:Uncharacterized protein n=2 Tax=Plasmodium ovale TaxID=36330 RepID=A0A1A8VUU1_PLAOA|nr:conserved Plasmodium protein, unknown function [Plasmodium ovale curtisi]SBS89888.1 conserved Plasmodium protein, unknown function [Plasmodium ovale curtisi]SCP04310.1 conserved Plasmodium protein, unknown function [Plasmodium ovale]
MEKCDIEYLNIPEKIKKKLYSKNLNTIEKLSTHYLEDNEIEEIDFVQNEIFKYHLKDLGIKEDEGETEDMGHGYTPCSNNVLSFSDEEKYCGNNNGLYNGDDHLSRGFPSPYTSSVSAASSPSSARSISTTSSTSSRLESDWWCDWKSKMIHNRTRDIFTVRTNGTTHSHTDKSSTNGGKKTGNVKRRDVCRNHLERDLFTYSNFMKGKLKNRRIVKTDSTSLNNLLCEGIENSKIYFFYGDKKKMNKIILVNMLYNFITYNNTQHCSVVFLHFSYISDVSLIYNIITGKIKKEREKKKKNVLKDDILRNFYIVRIQSFKELLSFLTQVKNNHLKKKKNTMELLTNDLSNLTCIGIYNFTNLLKNMDIINANASFYLIRELKIIANMLNMSIIIFDHAKRKEAINVTSSKGCSKERPTRHDNSRVNEEIRQVEYDRIREKMNTCTSYKNNINHFNNTDEENTYSSTLFEDIPNYSTKNKKIKNQNTIFDLSVDDNNKNDTNSSCVVSSEDESNEEYEQDDESENTEDGFLMNIHINDILKCNINDKRKNAMASLYNKKFNLHKTFIPHSISNKFDFVIEMETINKVRNKNVVRFTLLKSHNSGTHFYAYCRVKNLVLTDVT